MTSDDADDDTDYRSSEDEDFDPATAAAAAAATAHADDSSDEDSGSDAKPSPKKRGANKRQRAQSDDPAPARKIKTRAHRRLHGDHDEEDGQPRGAVVLAAAKAQRATDVDALWAAMNSPAAGAAGKPGEAEAGEGEAEGKAEGGEKPTTETETGTQEEEEGEAGQAAISSSSSSSSSSNSSTKAQIHEEPTVTISRTYTFAGQQHTEHRVVPRDSQEARVYLASLPAPTSSTNPTTPGATKPRRAAPRKRVSAFDSAAAARKPHTSAAPAAQKMNTLEKSRLDWAGFVDKEGIGEELRRHKMGEKAYLERQAFLGRVEERGEMALKEGRKKGP